MICIIGSSFNYFQKTEELTKNQVFSGYVLKEYKGKIAVFSGDDLTPIEVFNVEYSSLPYVDQLELLKGIKANDLKKIYQIAEDFDG